MPFYAVLSLQRGLTSSFLYRLLERIRSLRSYLVDDKGAAWFIALAILAPLLVVPALLLVAVVLIAQIFISLRQEPSRSHDKKTK